MAAIVVCSCKGTAALELQAVRRCKGAQQLVSAMRPTFLPFTTTRLPRSVASRLLAPTLNALNAFLLGNGRDVAAQLPALHAAYHDTAIRGSGRDARLREAAVTYLRIQLQLGTLPRGSAHLQDVQDWVDRELGLPAFKWCARWCMHPLTRCAAAVHLAPPLVLPLPAAPCSGTACCHCPHPFPCPCCCHWPHPFLCPCCPVLHSPP